MAQDCEISKISASLKDNKNKPALIPFVVSGYPDLESTKELLYLFKDHNVAIVELGIPFSDPLADGPVIQDAALKALAKGVSIDKIFDMLFDIKDDYTIPVVLFSYINPILSYGFEKFLEKAASVGVSGLIIPDLPLEESEDFLPLLKKYNLDLIMLIAPTSGEQRVRQIAKSASGFIYLVSSTGVTGVRDSFSGMLSEIISQIKEETNVPISVGFGVSKAEHIQSLEELGVDGAIVGSAIVKLLAEYKDDRKLMISKVSDYLKSLYLKV